MGRFAYPVGPTSAVNPYVPAASITSANPYQAATPSQAATGFIPAPQQPPTGSQTSYRGPPRGAADASSGGLRNRFPGRGGGGDVYGSSMVDVDLRDGPTYRPPWRGPGGPPPPPPPPGGNGAGLDGNNVPGGRPANSGLGGGGVWGAIAAGAVGAGVATAVGIQPITGNRGVQQRAPNEVGTQPAGPTPGRPGVPPPPIVAPPTHIRDSDSQWPSFGDIATNILSSILPGAEAMRPQFVVEINDRMTGPNNRYMTTLQWINRATKARMTPDQVAEILNNPHQNEWQKFTNLYAAVTGKPLDPRAPVIRQLPTETPTDYITRMLRAFVWKPASKFAKDSWATYFDNISGQAARQEPPGMSNWETFLWRSGIPASSLPPAVARHGVSEVAGETQEQYFQRAYDFLKKNTSLLGRQSFASAGPREGQDWLDFFKEIGVIDRSTTEANVDLYLETQWRNYADANPGMLGGLVGGPQMTKWFDDFLTRENALTSSFGTYGPYTDAQKAGFHFKPGRSFFNDYFIPLYENKVISDPFDKDRQTERDRVRAEDEQSQTTARENALSQLRDTREQIHALYLKLQAGTLTPDEVKDLPDLVTRWGAQSSEYKTLDPSGGTALMAGATEELKALRDYSVGPSVSPDAIKLAKARMELNNARIALNQIATNVPDTENLRLTKRDYPRSYDNFINFSTRFKRAYEAARLAGHNVIGDHQLARPLAAAESILASWAEIEGETVPDEVKQKLQEFYDAIPGILEHLQELQAKGPSATQADFDNFNEVSRTWAAHYQYLALNAGHLLDASKIEPVTAALRATSDFFEALTNLRNKDPEQAPSASANSNDLKYGGYRPQAPPAEDTSYQALVDSERDTLNSLRPFFPIMGTDALEDTVEMDELKQQNILMGQMRPVNWPLGNIDNKFWVDNLRREGFRYTGKLQVMPTLYSGGSLTDGATLYGSWPSIPTRMPNLPLPQQRGCR